MGAAGDYRERVQIQDQTATMGEYGLQPGDWANAEAFTRAAKVRPLRAVEHLRAAEDAQETDFIVTMRYNLVAKPTSRLVWRGKNLYITGIIDVNAAREDLEIMCTEREPTLG